MAWNGHCGRRTNEQGCKSLEVAILVLLRITVYQKHPTW